MNHHNHSPACAPKVPEGTRPSPGPPFRPAQPPNRTAARGLGIPDVVDALRRSSGAAGGNYLRHGGEGAVVV